MIARSFLICLLLPLSAAADDPDALFQEAERLARGNQKVEAMAKVEQAVAEIDRRRAKGENISWQGTNGLRFAARLAREDFLDYKKSLGFCDKLFQLADSDYWRVPARLERALTYRAMRDFQAAQREYDAIAVADERQRVSALLPQAEMLFFEVGEKAKGRALLADALSKEAIGGRERFNSLRKCVQNALEKGNRGEALQWYAMLEKLPFKKTEERARYLSQAWYEMGQIEESLGRGQQAKTLYRMSMELQDGDTRYRARSRDALESIEYFE